MMRGENLSLDSLLRHSTVHSAPLNYLRCTFNLVGMQVTRSAVEGGAPLSHGVVDRFTHSPSLSRIRRAPYLIWVTITTVEIEGPD